MSALIEVCLELNELKARQRGAIQAMCRAIQLLEAAQGQWFGVEHPYVPQWVDDLRDVAEVLETGVSEAQDSLTDDTPNITLPTAS